MSDKHGAGVRACLITNARSRRSTFHPDQALPVLLQNGWDVAVREKRKKGQATELARQAADDGYDIIVNCGGDGTLAEIVEALVGTNVGVGVIPGGTENVWPKEFGIAERSEVAAAQLVASCRARVDVGCLRIDGKHPHHFVMMGGLGADGAVMARSSRSLKNRIGPTAVAVAALDALPSLRSVVVELEMDGLCRHVRTPQIIVGNIRGYGGFTRATPNALADDGALDICVLTPSGIGSIVRQAASLLLAKRPSLASAEFYRAHEITIRTPIRIPIQLDGSAIKQKSKRKGAHAYQFSVLRRGLSVLVPPTYNGSLFEHGLDALHPGPGSTSDTH